MNWNRKLKIVATFFLNCFLFLCAAAQESINTMDSSGTKITVAASKRYEAPGILESIFLGKNYRYAWSQPVQMPVFNLGKRGFKILELGGGQQTKSLRLQDGAGTEWVLRTVDKDVDGAMPPKLKGTIAQKVVQGLISAAHPYAPLVVAELAKAVSVSAPHPVLYYVPDDPAFGPYQKVFAHRICYLELRNPTPDGSETINTADMQEALTKKPETRILQQQVLRARLLDMLIADWDRHADQWRWGVQDSAEQNFYYAIPRDRDQAFFNATGLIPRIGKAVAMQHLNWFKKKPRGLQKLNYKSYAFDRIFLNSLDAADWEAAIRKFQKSLSDDVIDKAVACMPPEVHQKEGTFFSQRLKSRREGLLRPVMRYYRQLAAEVAIWGTAEPDIFEISNSGEGLLVQVFAMAKNGEKGAERYRRVFSKKESKTLHLHGLDGADRFVINNLPKRLPHLHLRGGSGNDVFEIKKKFSRKIHLRHSKGK